MIREKPVGIDLGTTNSAVAWVDDSGRSAMVTSAEGELLTPSVVLFGDREVVVGKEARRAATLHPELVAEWVKRDIGQARFSRPIRGEYLPPEVIQACILRKLKADVVRTLGPDTRAVITVPAYFDEPRRKATSDAGKMAGVKVLDIVNEPTAAALAFGEAIGYLSPAGAAREEMVVLIYDLGGGTFDATLLRLVPANIQTLATDGDVQLGGHDWDERLVNYIAESFQRAHGIDPRRNASGLTRLYSTAVEAKHTLSVRTRVNARLEYQGRTHEIAIARDKFEELTADLLERTAYTTRQLLRAAKLEWKDVTRILLVGGATRMPMVGQMLERLAGILPDQTVNPDEAVARGAALYASYLLAKEAEGQSAFEVTNVNSHSLGVEGIEQETLRKTNVVLIPRNTPLPAKSTERFITKAENQRSIAIRILEGESSMPGECTAIGHTVLRELPSGLPMGWPVDVTFEYGTNGRLSVRAIVPGTHHEVTLELERASGLSDARVARWKLPVESAAGFDAFQSLVDEVLQGPDPGESGVKLVSRPIADSLEDSSALADAIHPSARGSTSQGVQTSSPIWTAGAVASPVPGSMPDADSVRPIPEVDAQRASQTGIPRWLVSLIGYLTSAFLGLGLGYLILSHLRPEFFPWPW